MGQHQKHDYFPPDSFGRAVQDELGDHVMLRLRQTLGGQDIRIPRARWTLLDDHWLVVAIGRKDAERLSFLFDGEQVYVPALADPQDTEGQYRELVRAGRTNREIADLMQVTRRHVRRRLAAIGITNPNRDAPKRKILTAEMAQVGPTSIPQAVE